MQILRCKSTVVATCQSTRVAINTFTDEADKLPKETLPEPLQFRLDRATGEIIYLTTAPMALRRKKTDFGTSHAFYDVALLE